jgi:hypothetical protein
MSWVVIVLLFYRYEPTTVWGGIWWGALLFYYGPKIFKKNSRGVKLKNSSYKTHSIPEKGEVMQ